MSRVNYGRHLPVFILLFLARERMHGLMLVAKLNETMPSIKADGPAIYRALAELEKQGAVEAVWETDQPGAAKKSYTLTETGRELLAVYAVDIEERKKNLEYFLAEVGKLPRTGA